MMFGRYAKMIVLCQNKDIDKLKLGCTLANLAHNCLHKSMSTVTKIYPLTDTDKDLLHKTREEMVSGPAIVFTRKAFGDEISVQNSTYSC